MIIIFCVCVCQEVLESMCSIPIIYAIDRLSVVSSWVNVTTESWLETSPHGHKTAPATPCLCSSFPTRVSLWKRWHVTGSRRVASTSGMSGCPSSTMPRMSCGLAVSFQWATRAVWASLACPLLMVRIGVTNCVLCLFRGSQWMNALEHQALRVIYWGEGVWIPWVLHGVRKSLHSKTHNTDHFAY